MADLFGLQPPPTKKFRSGTNTNETDFDYNKMMSPFDTPETNNTPDLFDIVNDFNDPLDNTQQTATSVNQQQNLYQSQAQQQQQQQQQRVNYITQTRPQSSSYQTPNLQRIPTMPTPTIVRPSNVISNGIQQQTTSYSPQQMINTTRPVYPRMPPPQQQQNMPSTLVRQQYNTTGMVPMNQNVTQMSIVKSSDPNNNSVFVTNPQQQQSTLVSLQPQHTVTQTAQINKPISTGLPSLSQTQLNQFQIQQTQMHIQQQQQQQQQQNSLQSYNIRTPMMDQTSTNPANYIITTQPQQVQQSISNVSSSNPLNVPTSTNNSQQHTEAQRKQFIQKQLVLLLHAHKCQQREKQTINGEPTRPNACTLPHCSTMKSVLQHMTKCNDHKTCTVPHCVTSRQIILHWKQCNNPQCPICQPLKTPSTLAKLNQASNNNNNNNNTINNINLNPNSLNQQLNIPLPPPTTTSTTINKEWQRRVTQEMRNHLVQKIITALIPITDTGAVRDKRIINLANYARRVENETFEIANNQEEYFHKLAEKIYKIQKELEDRREKKRLQDMQLTAQISSTNDFNGKMHSTMDTMAGDHGPPNRTAPIIDYPTSAAAAAAGNLLQSQTIKSEPLTTLTNRTMINTNNNNPTSTTFAVTNVPSNENLNFLLNGVMSTVNPSHDIDMHDTTRNNLDGTNQFKNEPLSPKNLYQPPTIKKEELIGDNYSSNLAATTATVITKPLINSSTTDETKSKLPQIDAASKQLPKHPVQFSSDDLRAHLEPVIHKMIACEDSHPFRQPVDPVALNILDYPSIIKHPMDISTMHNKLLHGEYRTPLQFCDDAWLMFNNAWLYNKKTTRVYKMCTKLSEVFADTIDPIIEELGYCCGRQYVYLPQVMFCYGNQLCCQIPRDGNYYYYNNPEPSRINLSGDKYTFCSKCFDSVKGDSICVGDDPAQSLVEIPKNLFLLSKNDIQEPEASVDCIVCTRRWHQVCALHLDQVWPEGFICPTCVRDYNIKRKENRFTAPKLTVTDLALRLEQRVNDFLRNEGCVTGRVTIRILAASDKLCEVKPRLKKYYPNQVPEGYPYRTKAIFAFQEIEGVDVVLFGMHVQEYDGRCQAPNTRRVYVSYLDSVHFFRPKMYRTEVYHEILIGYLDYAKQLGYVYAHIWACPPSEGDDYIFHCHPLEQRVPKPKRLQDWYKKMLDRAILERVVIDYKDVMKDCLDNQVQTALNIPYFEGDFWSNIIEESIKELDQEEEDRRKQEVEAARAMEDGGFDDPGEPEDSTDISDKRKSTTTYKKKNLKKTTSSQRKVAKKQMSNCTDLLSKIFSTMEKHKEAFFVIRLRNPIATCPAVNDTDALIQCDLMDTRDAFLNFARDKHYEFSSLRRARFSTMALLYELHTSTTDKFTYNCNTCRQQCEIRYHCTVCEDFDLCEKCYNIEPKHEHKMERSVPSMIEDCDQNSSNPNGKSMASSQLQRQQSMQRCIEALLHAVNCRNANCVNRSCFRYKRVIQHTKECKGKNSQCNVCKQVIFLCWYHAKSCMDQNCQVPFCTNLKTKIQKQRATSLQTDRRRMQAMMQQRTNTMQPPTQVSVTPSRTDSIPNSSHISTYDSTLANQSMNNSTGKPSLTLIRTPQPTNWHNQPQPQQQTYIMPQKPNNGKPLSNLSQQQSPSQLSLLINRVKQDPSMDEQQRSDINDQNKQQPMFSSLINKTPVNRLPSTTYIQPQQTQQPQQWYSTTSQQQFNPPPNYTTATRARYPPVMPQQTQNQSSPQTLLAPLRSNSATPPPTYMARTGSAPNLTRPPLIRPSQFPSQQQQQPPSQDPSIR
ncbi:unnamed protein product [Adineta steineri]|uniref:histone acetyltransferase n=1 Tax=Adineta steineri TaxID=433720 RepID=A0A814H2Y0_9BILA|nr:unnamed protein product [Adineta steineri]CAF1548712.1 unnamed protein product [Adineta steineri]